MQLLDLKTVRKEKEKGVEERINRVEKLHNAENNAVKGLNEKRSFIESEKGRLDEDLRFHAEKIKIQKATLSRELSSLEDRRADALKPIKQQKKEADDRIVLADEKERENIKSEISLSDREDKLLERLDSLSSSEQELNEKKEYTDSREKNVKKQEESNKQSTEKLSKLWIDYHKKINESNADLAQREKDVQNQSKTNTDFNKSLHIKEESQKDKDREIQDKYSTLQRSIDRFNKKKNV